MLNLLESLVNQPVTLLVSGHYVDGTLTALNIIERLAYLDTGKEKWIIAIEHIGMVKAA